MTTIKLKFRPSRIVEAKGTLYLQVIHKRVVRQVRTGCHILASEWDKDSASLIFPRKDVERVRYLMEVQNRIEFLTAQLKEIICYFEMLNKEYSADELILHYEFPTPAGNSWFAFCQKSIDRMIVQGRVGTSEAYKSAFHSFKNFMEGRDIAINDLNVHIMMKYERYLHNRGLASNTSAFYLRNLRAMYNHAVRLGLVKDKFPFEHVFTGVDKTAKRAISIKFLRRIKNAKLKPHSGIDFACDMFLFGFYTRGMPFVDIAYLRKENLSNGLLVYRRHKTGHQLFIKMEPCIQDIINKYIKEDRPYLLPIIRKSGKERSQYKSMSKKINKNLKKLGKIIGMSSPLTFYVARHTWASTARRKQVPLAVISEGMGHSSESTTRIYLSTLGMSEIDRANHLIIKSI